MYEATINARGEKWIWVEKAAVDRPRALRAAAIIIAPSSLHSPALAILVEGAGLGVGLSILSTDASSLARRSALPSSVPNAALSPGVSSPSATAFASAVVAATISAAFSIGGGANVAVRSRRDGMHLYQRLSPALPRFLGLPYRHPNSAQRDLRPIGVH
jgi:hypothetical protein